MRLKILPAFARCGASDGIVRAAIVRLAVLALGLTCVFPVYAADDAKRVFIGTAARGEDAERIRTKIDEALRVHFVEQGTDVIARPPLRRAVPEGALADVQKLLTTARTQFLTGAFADAVGTCDDGIARFESTFAYEGQRDAWDAYAELMLVRALALRRLDKKGPADRTLGALAAQMPSYVPDPSLVPPKATERYAVIKRRLSEVQTPPLSVQSVPAGATVLVDGRAVGKTPLDLQALPAGPHYVAVRSNDARVDEYVVLRNRPLTVRAVFEDELSQSAQIALGHVEKGGAESAYVTSAKAVAPVTMAAVITREEDGSFTIIIGRVQHSALGVAAMSVAPDLSDIDEVTALLADVSSERDAAFEQAPGPLKSAFLDAGPGVVRSGSGGASGSEVEAEDEDGAWTGPIVGGVVGAGALVVALAVAGGLGAYFYLTAPSNPGGTDVVIDASRL